MDWHLGPAELKRLLNRWRQVAYAIAAAGMSFVLLIRPDWRAAAAVAICLGSLVLSRRLSWASPHWLLIWDLGASVWVWWLYGPISGAAFIALGVVAIGPFLMDQKESRRLIVMALMTVPLEVILHFVAGGVDLPLFHPPGPVPTSEFVIGEAIKAALLLGVGALMIGVAQMLRRGQQALAADLDRERELNALKDRFVATVSHQLRTPLTSLKGFTRALLEDDMTRSERHEFLTIMSDQAEDLHALIEDLITFSRIGAGGLTIRSAPVQLHQLIDSVLSGFGVRANTVSNQVPNDIVVQVDSPRLRQVIRNLVDNALKYGQPPVVVTAIRNETRVLCSVLDAGRGIGPEEQARVFEPYARLVDDRTMSVPGLGLGLPIARDLVEAHGGTIRPIADGNLSGFEFTLPSAAPDKGVDKREVLDSIASR